MEAPKDKIRYTTMNKYGHWEMICENCKYFHKLKYGFETGKGFKESSCCIALTRQNESPDDYDSFVIETNEDDTCEMFEVKDLDYI